MIILGISGVAHDSAAAIIQEGKIIVAIEEERVTRLKNAWTFPSKSIKLTLSQAGIASDEIDAIAFYWNDHSQLIPSILSELKQIFNLRIPTFRRIKNRFSAALMQNKIKKIIYKELFKNSKKKVPVYFLNHHLCHLAYSFLCSPFDTATGLIIDGRGEFATISSYECANNKFKKIFQINMPHSLGYVYAAFTQYLGFCPLSDEYRVMGLAPYGAPNPKLDLFFEDLIRVHNNTIEINMEYCNYQYTEALDKNWLSDKAISFLDSMLVENEDEMLHKAKIAYALQKRVEYAIITLVNIVHNITNNENLVLGGGVAMNSVCNKKIANNVKFKQVFVPPAPSDQGCAIGAALYLNQLLSKKFVKKQNNTPYLGPEYSAREIEALLNDYKLQYKRCKNIATIAAQKISEGKICGFFQGRMEFGSRALGNRSILADPRDPSMRHKINGAIKFREMFRPFAGTVLIEHAKEFSEDNIDSPYMSFVTTVVEDKRKLIPAVTHVDDTCRFQTLKREDNAIYYDVIQEFYNLTGIPVVLNTSFNIKGEPIVMTPTDAIRCFFSTGLDILIISNYMIEK